MSKSATDACARKLAGRPKQKRALSLAPLFKALGDENRLAMVEMIAHAGELCACEIEEHFELSQPTISHHLKLLRDAGILEGERRGTWIFYRVVPEALAAIGGEPLFEKR